MKKRTSIVLAIGLCLAALSGCAQKDQAVHTQSTSTQPASYSVREQETSKQESHYPLTLSVYDDRGSQLEQTIEKEPQRIVVIGQGFAEWMIGLGEEKRIAGLAYLDKSFSSYEPQIQSLPVMTDMWPSREAVLELHPDLIIAMSSAFQKDRLGDISFWNDRGIPVLTGINYTIGRTIDSFYDDISNLGKALNIEDKTNAFIEGQKSQIREIQAKAARAADRPRVLLLGVSGNTTWYYGPSLVLIDEMIEGAGGEYIKVSDETYVEMSDESILAVNPDKIIITGFQKEDREALINQYLQDPKLKNAIAVQNGAVETVDYTTAVRGGLDLADMYRNVAEFIHPE